MCSFMIRTRSQNHGDCSECLVFREFLVWGSVIQTTKVPSNRARSSLSKVHFWSSYLDTSYIFFKVYFGKTEKKSTLAFCNQELKQRNEDGILLPEWNHFKGQIKVVGSNNRHPRKQFTELTNLSGSKSTEVSYSMSLDEFGAVDSLSVPSTSRVAEVTEYPRHQTTALSALVELTTRLDFFKESRSQLMEQLHNLDLNYGVTATSHDDFYRPSSPSWS